VPAVYEVVSREEASVAAESIPAPAPTPAT